MTTLPTSVNKVVQDYLFHLKKIISTKVVGVYLTGSVSLGDYYTNKSDIDFITITEDELPEDLLYQLKIIHHNIEQRHNQPKLNDYYLTTAGLENNELLFPSFFKNKLYSKSLFELKNFSLFELKFFSYRVF